MKKYLIASITTGLLLAGCSGSPGPLEGTWKASGPMPMTITFRPGETEAMGVIEHVDYKTEGNSVEVTYKDGLMKGSSMRYVIVDRNTATNPMFTLHRVR
jgi:hypothetical protein